MSIDATVEHGLQVARLGDTTREKISRVIATPSKTMNPVDFFPDMLFHGFERTSTEILKALLEDDGVDGIICISFADSEPNIYEPMVDLLRKQPPKPVFFSLLGPKEDMETCQSLLEGNHIPCYDFPEYAVRVFAHMWRYNRMRRKSKPA
jgi:acetyltransferase